MGWTSAQGSRRAVSRVLTEEGFQVELSDTLEAFNDEAKLSQLDLIVPALDLRPAQAGAAGGADQAVRKPASASPGAMAGCAMRFAIAASISS